MARTISIEVEMPGDMARFKLPRGVNARLQALLDKQDSVGKLTPTEKREAEGLVNLAELLTLLRMRSERAQRADGNGR